MNILPIFLPHILAEAAGPAHMSPFAYARLAAADLWLWDYDGLLYVDSDTRLAGKLATLFRLDLDGAVAAMAEDCGRYLGDNAGREDWDEYRRRRTGLPLAGSYFNSGVLLLDAVAWRVEGLWKRPGR